MKVLVSIPTYNNAKYGYTIKQTLDALTKQLILSLMFLKMNCDGCEYDLILNDYDAIRLFKEIIFEGHEKFMDVTCNSLLDRLSYDYKCSILKLGITTKIIYCVKRLS